MTVSIDAGRGLANYNNELLLADGSNLFSYNQGSDTWTDKGPFISVQVNKASVNHDSLRQLNVDGATDLPTGLQAYAWENRDANGALGVYYSIIDGTTGQVIVPSTVLSSDGIRVRVVAVSGRFVFYYYDTVTERLKVALLPCSTPSATPVVSFVTAASSTVNGISTTSSNYDVCVIDSVGQYVAVAFNNADPAGGTTLRMYQAANLTTYTQATLAYNSHAITVFPAKALDGNLGPVVAYSTSGATYPYTTSIRYAAYTFSLALQSQGQIASGTTYNGSNVYGITGCQFAASGVGFDVFWNQYSPNRTSYATISSTYSVTLEQDWMLNCATAAKAFSVNDAVYVVLKFLRSEQPTLFVVRSDKEIVAKSLPLSAGSVANGSVYSETLPIAALPSVTVLGDNAFRFTATERANMTGTGLATLDGVAAITVDFDNEQYSYIHSTLGSNLHFTGGFVQMYDGADVVEHNFHVYPGVSANSQSSTGGYIIPGTYSYVGCYEWIDQQNNVHRSRPSAVSQIVVVAGTSTNTVTLQFQCLHLTNKPASRPVQLVLYRTTADGTVFYRVTSLTDPTLNQIGSASVQITDTMSDADLRVRPQLYTQFINGTLTGQPYEVENDPAPPARIVQLHRNRIWVVDSENPLFLWYSKECQQGAPVEFSNLFTKLIDARGGPITALASVDDKLVIFKQSHIFFIVGQGPTSNNLQNDLSDAILVTTDVGCIEPRSIVATPVGLMFKSRKGIYLIDRGLQVQYIGAPVEAFNSQVITSATLVADTNQVRFTLDNNTALVFDYFVQQWGVFTNHNAVDAIIWNNTFVYLRPNGQVLTETPGQYTDVGAPIQLKLTTSWLSFANVQGFQRVRRAQILGGWKSPHQLLVNVSVDFDDSVIQSSVVTPETPSVYGDTSPYGGDPVYGGNFQLYQWRVDLARQKTQSVKFTIQDLPTATAGEGMSLTSLAFEVGAKVGLNKVPATQIVG